MKNDNKTSKEIEITNKKYIKWRGDFYEGRKNGIDYWSIEGELLTNEELFDQYKKYFYEK